MTVIGTSNSPLSSDWATAGLVPGLKLRVPGTELKELLEARAAYHDKRRQEKEALLPELKAAADKVKAHTPEVQVQLAKVSNSRSYQFDGDSAVENLERDIRDHADKAVSFRFMAAHLFAGATYCLDQAELVRIELVKL